MPRPKQGRLSGIKRTVGLIAELMAGRTFAAKIAAEKLGVKVAAAARQLRAIEALPGMSRDRSSKAHVWQYTPHASSLGYDKVIAACLGSSLAPAFEGTQYRAGFESVRQWIIEQSALRRNFRNIDRKFRVLLQGGEVGLSREDSPLDEVLDALLKERMIKVTYEHFGGQKQTLVVAPLSLLLHQHRLYLVVRQKSGKYRPLRFARIRSVELQGRFVYPSEAEYSPQSIFAESYGVFIDAGPVTQVRFKLTEKWRVFVKTHRWHLSQSSEEHSDGVVVTMRVRLCPELEAFLLGFGEECAVLEPPALKERMQNKVAKMAKLYHVEQARGC